MRHYKRQHQANYSPEPQSSPQPFGTSRRPKPENQQPIIQGLSVKVWNNDVNKALRKFKKLVQKDGKLQLIKERRYYMKPSEIKRKAKETAIRKQAGLIMDGRSGGI